MRSVRAFELLSAAMDGDLSADEQAELDALLKESPEARRLQRELHSFDKMLGDLPDLDPPSGLADRIMGRIPARGEVPQNPIGNWLSSWSLGAVLRYGFACTVGAMLAVTFYENQPNPIFASDITELVGTMAPDSDSPNRKILDSFSFAQPGVSSVARLERRKESLLIDVRIDTTRPVEIAMDFSASEFEFEALAQTQSTFEAIEFSDGVLRVKGRGQRRFAVLLRSDSAAAFSKETIIALQYSSEGDLLQQEVLRSIR